MNTKVMVRLAAVAAIYVVMTVAVAPLSYGPIQFRFSEVLVLLCFFRRDYIYSLIIGCFIANLFSPELPFDYFFGTIHSGISAIIISRMKNLLTASFIPTIFMFIIALQLHIFLELPFWLILIQTMIGEFVVVTVIGFPMFSIIRKNVGFIEIIQANQNIGEV